VPYLDKAVNVSSSFMRYGRHFNRVTWLLVNAHLPARLDSDYLQLAKGFSAKKLHYWRIPSLGHSVLTPPTVGSGKPSQNRGEAAPNCCCLIPTQHEA